MDHKDAARLFASMGGKARASKLSKQERSEIARKGGLARADRYKRARKKALRNHETGTSQKTAQQSDIL
jgi:hypothetical protein